MKYGSAKAPALIPLFIEFIRQMLGNKRHELFIRFDKICLDIFPIIISSFIFYSKYGIGFIMRHNLLNDFIFSKQQCRGKRISFFSGLIILFPQSCLFQHFLIGQRKPWMVGFIAFY